MIRVLLARKARSGWNALRAQGRWDWARNAGFSVVGVWMLYGLHAGFFRLIAFLDGLPLIGPLLVWKLAGMAFLTTFTMVALSSLIISLTTLFYSFDLPFLMNAPLTPRAVFVEKSIETTFFSSWMIALVLAPFIAALGRAHGLGPGFYAGFSVMLVPFVVLAAAIGMAATLVLLYVFPSSRTRDAIWLLSSASMAVVYVLLRVAQPERLARPDAVRVVTEYLNYLESPTAPSLPLGWLTRATEALAAVRHGGAFWGPFAALCAAGAAAYGALLWLADRSYAAGYSGAQEGARHGGSQEVREEPEQRLARRLGMGGSTLAALFWKERRAFFRDVKHWSQIVLILALACVYLFSIRRLPVDTPDLKNLVAFLNLGIAGFVIASLGLRFTFPSISMDGRAWWVVRSAPIGLSSLMRAKFLFTLAPTLALSATLILLSNRFLGADRFIAWLSLGTIVAMTVALVAMGVGFGALFPRFDLPNIHQMESSAGGFVYMAAALFYIGCTLALEALPVQMHFQERFGRSGAWDALALALCGLGLAGLNGAALLVPWQLGRRRLEAYEV